MSISYQKPGGLTAAERTKLAGIEAGATADQNANEIRTALETLAGAARLSIDFIQDGGIYAVMTLLERAKLLAIEANATADQTAVEIRNALETLAGANRLDGDSVQDGATNLFFTAAERAKLLAIEASATADQTAAEIKAALETLAGANRLDADFVKDGATNVFSQWTTSGDVLQNIAAIGEIKNKLGDAAGAKKWYILDSGDVQRLTINSDGEICFIDEDILLHTSGTTLFIENSAKTVRRGLAVGGVISNGGGQFSSYVYGGTFAQVSSVVDLKLLTRTTYATEFGYMGHSGGIRKEYIKPIDSGALSGATQDIAINLPAGAKMIYCAYIVKTLITGATDFDLDWAVSGGAIIQNIVSGAAVAKNTKGKVFFDANVNTAITPAGTTVVRATANGSNFTAGEISLVCCWEEITDINDYA